MLSSLYLFLPLIISFFLFMTGSSLLLTVLTLVFHDQQISVYWTASLTCAYYAGYVLSAIHVESFIVRVGFIRAHAAFAALATLSTLLHLFWFNPILWITWRFTYGVGLAGLCLVTQNWLLSTHTSHLRGRMLAIYMITMYASQSFGQYILRFMDMTTLLPFCVIAFFTTLCILPVIITKSTAPACSHYSIFGLNKVFEISPSGTLGGLCSGVLMGCIYGIYPDTLKSWHYPLTQISTLMALVIIGGMFLQYPVGRLADFLERRVVLLWLIGICFLCTVFSLWLHHLGWDSAFIWMTFLWGGFTFTIHPVCINLACDQVTSKDLLSTTGGLMIAYSIGASLGPFLGAGCMRWMGPGGFYILFMGILLFMGIFVYRHKLQHVGTPVHHQKAFTFLPSGVTMSMSRSFAYMKRRKHNKIEQKLPVEKE